MDIAGASKSSNNKEPRARNNEAEFRNEGPSPKCIVGEDRRHSGRIVVDDVRGGLVGVWNVSNRAWWESVLGMTGGGGQAAQSSFPCRLR